MKVSINSINCNGTICNEAKLSVAATDSIAVRVVPVDSNDIEYPDFAIGIVGAIGDLGTDVVLSAIQNAVQSFISSRGV